MATYTPWGMSQHSDKIATGIMKYDTASHGGIHLSTKRNSIVPDYMRNEDGWYEEDCEWAIVACVFPTEYAESYKVTQPGLFEIAKDTLRHYMPDMFERFYGEEVKPGQSTTRDEENFHKDHADDYIVISAIGDGDIVKCIATKGGKCDYSIAQTFIVPADEYRIRSSFGFVIDETKHFNILTF